MMRRTQVAVEPHLGVVHRAQGEDRIDIARCIGEATLLTVEDLTN